MTDFFSIVEVEAQPDGFTDESLSLVSYPAICWRVGDGWALWPAPAAGLILLYDAKGTPRGWIREHEDSAPSGAAKP